VKGEALPDDGVVAPLYQRYETGLERGVALAREIGRVTGATQQRLHLARPIFLLDVDQRFQLAQMMRIAQSVQHIGHRVIRLPMIMHDDAADLHDVAQQGAAFGADAVEGEQRRAGDMQPHRLAADAKAGFVHVFYVGARDAIAQRLCKTLEPRRASAAHASDGRA
jgi:hypothetical protein